MATKAPPFERQLIYNLVMTLSNIFYHIHGINNVAKVCLYDYLEMGKTYTRRTVISSDTICYNCLDLDPAIYRV